MTAPYTPETLADRWQCSARHIRNMVKDGRLPGFRLGGKLLRIGAGVVEEMECGDSDDIGDSGQQSAGPDPAESVLRLDRIERRQSEPSTA